MCDGLHQPFQIPHSRHTRPPQQIPPYAAPTHWQAVCSSSTSRHHSTQAVKPIRKAHAARHAMYIGCMQTGQAATTKQTKQTKQHLQNTTRSLPHRVDQLPLPTTNLSPQNTCLQYPLWFPNTWSDSTQTALEHYQRTYRAARKHGVAYMQHHWYGRKGWSKQQQRRMRNSNGCMRSAMHARSMQRPRTCKEAKEKSG